VQCADVVANEGLQDDPVTEFGSETKLLVREREQTTENTLEDSHSVLTQQSENQTENVFIDKLVNCSAAHNVVQSSDVDSVSHELAAHT